MYQSQIQVLARAAHWPISEYGEKFFSLTPSIIRQLRELEYLDQWRESINNQWYHVKMEDHSILTFSSDETSASYSYLQSPISAPTFRMFLESLELPFTSANRQKHQQDYESVLSTADIRNHITPIRYDYHESGYKCGVHPASHIHIGLDNQIRLAVNRRMTVSSFVLFVMRQMYPSCWERVLEHKESSRLPKVIRSDCPTLAAKYWETNDQIELHLA